MANTNNIELNSIPGDFTFGEFSSAHINQWGTPIYWKDIVQTGTSTNIIGNLPDWNNAWSILPPNSQITTVVSYRCTKCKKFCKANHTC